MARPPVPAGRRRVPLGITVSPASIKVLDRITVGLDVPWSRGSIVDRALELAEEELLREAAGRQIVVLLGSFPSTNDPELSP